MNRKEQLRKWLWYFSFPAAAVVLYKLYDNFGEALGFVGKLLGILAPFVGGFVLAFLLYAPCRRLEERFLTLKGKAWPKLARPLALLIVYLLFFGLLTAVIALLIPLLVSSLTDLAAALPDYLSAAHERILQWVAEDGPLGVLNLQDKVNDIYAGIAEAATKLITPQNVVGTIKRVGSVASSLIDVVIAFVVSVYMLHGREHLCRALQNFVSLFTRPRTLARLRGYTRRTGRIFAKYIYGALLDAFIVGAVVSVGLLIFGVPYAVLLGMILGVMNLVPYFGAILGGVFIAFITLLTNGLPTAIGVAIYIVVAQQVDANIIQPRIIGDSVGLRPFYVLLGITFFGGLFGFWGILLGPPLMAVVQMVARDIYARRAKAKEKEIEE